MKLKRKIGKLLSGAAYQSAKNSLYRTFHPIDTQEIIRTLDQQKLRELSDQYNVPYGGKLQWPKYMNVPHWLDFNIRRAQDLRLSTRKKPLHILDIGSGAGYFLVVARHLGHSGIGFDIETPPFYGEMFKFFGLDRVVSRVEPMTSLPRFNEKFDLVTGFSICFNGHKTAGLWTDKEWGFFLNDLRQNVLKPNGEIYLELNPEPGDENIFYTPELKRFFQKQGAMVDRHKVWFKS